MNFKDCDWILDKEFKNLESINHFRKEIDEIKPSKHKEDLLNRHMLVRKRFNISKIEGFAFIDITADDYYKLYINGNFVGQGPAPAYYFDYNYNRFDISKHIKEGENIIAVHVYYQGLINRVWNSGDYRQGMVAKIFHNNEVILRTDDTWKYMISKAYRECGRAGYDTQFLEEFDARLFEPEWVNYDFNDDKWEYVSVKSDIDYTFKLQDSKNLEVYEISCERFEKLDEGHYFIDFSQEITGQFKLNAKGNSGDRVIIRCAEELEDDNKYRIKYDMRCNCKYEDILILSGKEDRLNLFDYKAFRYVEVIANKNVIIDEDFKAIVRHYPFDDFLYQFESNNMHLNKIIKICKNGVKYGTQEGYLDCPTREKGQYLGDFTVTGHSHMYLTGSYELYKKTLKMFSKSSIVCPGLMAVTPGNIMQEIADFSMQWPLQIYQYYLQTGDSELLEELFENILELENYFMKYRREDGLLQGVSEKWNLVDWPDNYRDNYDCELTKPIGDVCHNVVNGFYYCMLYYIDEIRKVLGFEPKYDYIKVKESFINVFYNKKTKLFVDKENSNHSSVHSNVLPLLFGFFDEKDKYRAVELFKDSNRKYGVYMAYFVLKALSKVKEYELVYDLIESLWDTMVKEDATTCFEAWGKNEKFNTSLCHPWASAPISILVEEILGIKPLEPGFTKISFEPHISEALTEFKFQMKVKTGMIHLEKKNDSIYLKVPDGISVIRNMKEI